MNPTRLLAGAFLMAYLGCALAQIPPASVVPPPAGRAADANDPLRPRNLGSSPMLDINIDGEGIRLPRGVEERRPEQEPKPVPAPQPDTRTEGSRSTAPAGAR